jgi:putative CocE/NonD family hydrolase
MLQFYYSKKLAPVLFSVLLGITTPLLAQRRGAGAPGTTPVPDLAAMAAARRQATKEDSAFIRDHYKKVEMMVPMRDGAKLYTGIYIPKDSTKKYPIMMTRSPYGSAPYGAVYKTSLGPSMLFAKEGFIFVYQDVRGKFMSEGDFVATRPYIVNKKGSKDIDETTDTYDAIDWLIKNLPTNNGKVGTWGISAPGFYATMTAIDAHPALKAVSPQAPVTNWFLGDDRHHNGVFQEMGTFAFISGFGIPRPAPTTRNAPGFSAYGTPDGYQFYLNMGPLKSFDDKILHHSNPLWDEMMEHGNYDEYWQSRTPEPHLKNIGPAVMDVGGFFDQEDPYGPLKTFASIEKGGHKDKNMLVMGPWFHGGFSRGDGDFLGNIRFGDQKTGAFYRENIEFPFFMHYLKDTPDPQLPKAYVFESGSNQWKKYSAWPPLESVQKAIYLQPGNKLAFDKPKAASTTFDEYISDPAKPVPYSAALNTIRGSEFMIEDQRFAAERPDVLVYQTDVLTKDVTIAGNVMADLFVSTTGTDADFVVKVIDVYPDDAPNNSPVAGTKMGGFEMMVRGEIMRAKYRNSFSKPEPMVPGKVTELKWDVEDINHCFLAGHKIMIQIQSTWFPLNDRNPQKFVDIYKANESDFQKATQKVYFSPQYPSHVDVKLIEK